MKLYEKLIHKTFGTGTIINIITRTDAEPLIYIHFENDSKEFRMFTETSIKDFLIEE